MRCHWASPGFLTSLYQTSHLKPLPTSTQPNKWTWTLRDKDLNPSCLGSPPEVGSVLTFCAQWMPPDSNHGRMDHPRAPPGGRCAAALYYDWKVSCWRRECYLLTEIIYMCFYSIVSVCMLTVSPSVLTFRSSVTGCRLWGVGGLVSLICLGDTMGGLCSHKGYY